MEYLGPANDLGGMTFGMAPAGAGQAWSPLLLSPRVLAQLSPEMAHELLEQQLILMMQATASAPYANEMGDLLPPFRLLGHGTLPSIPIASYAERTEPHVARQGGGEDTLPPASHPTVVSQRPPSVTTQEGPLLHSHPSSSPSSQSHIQANGERVRRMVYVIQHVVAQRQPITPSGQQPPPAAMVQMEEKTLPGSASSSSVEGGSVPCPAEPHREASLPHPRPGGTLPTSAPPAGNGALVSVVHEGRIFSHLHPACPLSSSTQQAGGHPPAAVTAPLGENHIEQVRALPQRGAAEGPPQPAVQAPPSPGAAPPAAHTPSSPPAPEEAKSPLADDAQKPLSMPPSNRQMEGGHQQLPHNPPPRGASSALFFDSHGITYPVERQRLPSHNPSAESSISGELSRQGVSAQQGKAERAVERSAQGVLPMRGQGPQETQERPTGKAPGGSEQSVASPEESELLDGRGEQQTPSKSGLGDAESKESPSTLVNAQDQTPREQQVTPSSHPAPRDLEIPSATHQVTPRPLDQTVPRDARPRASHMHPEKSGATSCHRQVSRAGAESSRNPAAPLGLPIERSVSGNPDGGRGGSVEEGGRVAPISPSLGALQNAGQNAAEKAQSQTPEMQGSGPSSFWVFGIFVSSVLTIGWLGLRWLLTF